MVVSGDAQSGLLDQQLSPVVLEVLDPDGGPVANTSVTLAASPGAVPGAGTGLTNSQGQVSFTPRVGRAPGSYTFTASSPDAGGATFTASAAEPDAGTIWTAINVDRVSAPSGVPGPATAAHVGRQYGLAVTSANVLYVSDYSNCRVYAVDPAGAITLVAGTSCGYSGDGNLATLAQLQGPEGVAVDETRKLLYVAEWSGGRVRIIDLQSGLIDTFAGGGPSGQSNDGDDGLATSANLSNPAEVTVGANGDVYIGDHGHNRIRRVDSSGFIRAWLSPGSCSAPVAFNGCGYDTGCNIVWDALGNAFIGGQVCGTQVGGTVSGIVREATDGGLALVAGNTSTTATAEGLLSTATYLAQAPNLAMDPAGNLFYSDHTAMKIRRIEGGSGRVTTVAGTGAYGFSGDYGPGPSAQLNSPTNLALAPDGNLYWGEEGNVLVRGLAGVAASTPTPANMAIVGTPPSQATRDALAAAPLVVKLTDSTGATLKNFPVQWAVTTPGGYLVSNVVNTNLSGNSQVVPRVGLAAKAYGFTASFYDIHGQPISGSSASFSVSAVDPAAGTIFTVVNIDHSSGALNVPGIGTLAHVGRAYGGLVRASTGDLYFSDYSGCRVYKLTPDGLISVVAGGTCGHSGDNGPATSAGLSGPEGLALDEANGILYIAEWSGGYVRMVDLTTGTIYTAAGGGATGQPADGDGNLATSASLSNPSQLSIGPNGLLYIADQGHGRIRYVDAGGIIHAWLSPGSCSSSVAFSSCGYDTGCNLAWDVNGNAYVSGAFCGTSVGGTAPGVAMVAAGTGTLSLVAGKSGGSAADGIAATLAGIGTASTIALSPSGQLYIADYAGAKIRTIDSGGLIQTVAGTGTAGYAGDYVAATSAQLNAPAGILVDPDGHVFFNDGANYCMRVVW